MIAIVVPVHSQSDRKLVRLLWRLSDASRAVAEVQNSEQLDNLAELYESREGTRMLRARRQ